MNADSFFQCCLENHQIGTAQNSEDDYVLTGCIQLYKATHNMFYKSYIDVYIRNLISEKSGALSEAHGLTGYEREKNSTSNIFEGNIFLWLYEETKENKYKTAVEMLREQLREHPRTSCETYSHNAKKLEESDIEDLYCVEPFYMAYGTKFESKECYLDIVSRFTETEKYLNKDDVCSVGWYLMALVDTIDVMSLEIFEHYKTLEKLFKKVMSEVLCHQDKESGLFYNQLLLRATEDNYLSTQGSAMIAYAIMKACNLRVLLSEKYFDIGARMLEILWQKTLLKEQQDCDINNLGKNVICKNQKEFSILMMAYSQYKMQNKRKKFKELGCCYEQ